jgi:hypothetical protein
MDTIKKLESFNSDEILSDTSTIFGGEGGDNGCGGGTCTGKINMKTGVHTGDWDDEGLCDE